MKKDKGFTLIELLAVIVVLAVIALITTPLILNVIEKSKKGALQDSAYGLIESANIYYAQGILDESNTKTEFTFSNGEQTSESKLSYKGKIENGSLRLYSDGKTALCISEGKYSAIKNVDEKEVKVVSGSCTYNEKTEKYETTDKCTEELTALKKFGTAISAEILEGKTALIQGQEVTGSMKNNSGVIKDGTDVTESGENALIGVPEAGYYDQTSKISVPIETIRNNVSTLDKNFDFDFWSGGTQITYTVPKDALCILLVRSAYSNQGLTINGIDYSVKYGYSVSGTYSGAILVNLKKDDYIKSNFTSGEITFVPYCYN